MERIDAHQHFWNYNEKDYGWIDHNMQVIQRNFLPNNLKFELDKVGMNGSIAVQARQSMEETFWLLEMAEQHEFIKGVVGWVDLQSEGIEEQLVTLGRYKKLVGVRHVVHDEPDDNFMLMEAFLNGISHLAAYDLTYDLLLFPRHLPIALEITRLFPQQKFVIDHMAKPNIKEAILHPWAKNMEKMAACPNVYCKISGMVTEADWKNWRNSDFTPFIDVVYNAFGQDRLMFGSDWPVALLAGEYQSVLEVVENYMKDRRAVEIEKIFGKNCTDFYLRN